MKSKLILAACLLVAGLAACTEKDNPGEKQEPKAPVVEFSITEEAFSVTVGESREFKATVTAGENVVTAWYVNEEKVASTPSVTWRFTAVGTTIVKFEASNEVGKVEKTYTVTVNGEPLDVTYSVTDEVVNAVVGTPVEISVAINSGDKGTTHSWKLDGEEASTGLSFSKTFTEEETGEHSLVYEGANSDGMTASRNWTIVVSDLPLEVNYTPAAEELEKMVGDEVSFSAEVVHGAAGAAFSWKVGEEEKGTEASFKYTCEAEGTVTVSCTVTNAAEESDSRSWTITISPKVALTSYMVVDAEDLTELPPTSLLKGNDNALSIVENPVPGSTVNPGTKVFKDDLSSATWGTSGLVQVYTSTISGDIRYNYKTVRIKVYLGTNDYVPFMVVTNNNKASRPTKVNGTDFYPGHSEELWASLVKHDDWNVLEYNIISGNYESVAATMADIGQVQFRFMVNYNNSNYPNPVNETTNTHIVYFDDIELCE